LVVGFRRVYIGRGDHSLKVARVGSGSRRDVGKFSFANIELSVIVTLSLRRWLKQKSGQFLELLLID
jgi:hypothetical protein